MGRRAIEFATITVLTNPAARADSAAGFVREVREGLATHFSKSRVEFPQTTDAADLANIGQSSTSDLILCVGGDGTVHGVLQGLMQRPRAERPALCALPLGSGNDIARTFSIPTSPAKALASLAHGRLQATDVGACQCDGKHTVYFLETLSFGVDAATALRTVELRKRTRRRESLLYAQGAIDAIIHDLHTNHFRYWIDGQEACDDLLIMAIQNGPTYGGGFKVAPRARVDDGLLNICTAHKINTLVALYYLARIKGGTHERLRAIRTYEASRIRIELQGFVPAQVDGEPLVAMSYEIRVSPAALDVLTIPLDHVEQNA